jgi:hypothetical protein
VRLIRLFRRDSTSGMSHAGSWAAARDLPVSFERSQPVVFMHIPKTSGTAIISGLATALAPATVVRGFDHSIFGSFRNFDSLDESIRCQIYASPACVPKNADLVAGHIALSTLCEAYPLAKRLTLLREPMSRLLSHWVFWRQHTEADLAAWGDWADRVRQSRKPLVDFLSEPVLACQIDNLMLRMLLWPHPLLPAAQFIDPADDERLVSEAMAHLLEFDFVDVVENGALLDRLQCWLGRPLTYDRRNETHAIPERFRAPLHRELTPEAHQLLHARSRLDLRLWTEIAVRHLPDRETSKLREQTILANVARYSVLMAC